MAQVPKVDPEAEKLNKQGVELYYRKRFKKAMSKFTAALEIEPHYAEARFNRGLSHFELSDLNSALLDLNAAVALAPDVADIFYHRALVYESLRNQAASSQDLLRSLWAKGLSIELLPELGRRFEALSYFDAAAVAYKRVVKVSAMGSAPSELALSRLRALQAPGYGTIQTVTLDTLFDFSSLFCGYRVIGTGVGPEHEILCLGVKPLEIEDFRKEFHFLERLEHPVSYRIVTGFPDRIGMIDINNVRHPAAFVQPLPDGEILLVGARAHWHPKGNSEKNGHVYGPDGMLRREFCLGDGIADIQTTLDGRVWAIYFDEGVYGNFGWGRKDSSRPIGAHGIVCFDSNGLKIAEPKLPVVWDWLEALNVVSESELWCWAAGDGHFLIHVTGEKSLASKTNICLSHNSLLAISEDTVLSFVLAGECYALRRFGPHITQHQYLGWYRFVDSSGSELSCIHGRGENAYFHDWKGRVFRLRVGSLLKR